MTDAYKNFSYSTVNVAPNPPTSGTTLSVAAGEGGRFPAVPFNAVVCPAGLLPLPTNAEIVRVTAVAGDQWTMLRGQEGSNVRTIISGDQCYGAITKKLLDDIIAAGIAVHAPTHAAGGSDPVALSASQITSGVIGAAQLPANVALKDAANLFTDNQTVSKVSAPFVALRDSSQAAGSQTFRFINTGGTLYVQPTNDDGLSVPGATTLYIYRNGNIRTDGSVSERNRAVPMGDWIAYTPVWQSNAITPPANANLSGVYTMIGKTVLFRMRFVATSITTYGSPGGWAFSLPVAPNQTQYHLGGAWFWYAGGYAFTGHLALGNFFFAGGANAVTILCNDFPGAASALLLGPTVPFTWQDNCQAFLSGSYEMA